MSDKALELARRIHRNYCAATWHNRTACVDDIDRDAALLRPYVQSELFGRAMVVLKGLSLAVEWELHPSIKKEIDAICAEFESASAPVERKEG